MKRSEALNGARPASSKAPATSSSHLGFVDAQLPHMEGTSLAASIRASRPGLSLILISGYFYEDDDGVRECIAEALFWGFISKPFQAPDIRKAVAMALGAD